jgi:uncharacterized lipoprotein YehR (DUF1307 family)
MSEKKIDQSEIEALTREITARVLMTVGEALKGAGGSLLYRDEYACDSVKFECTSKYTCSSPDSCENIFKCTNTYTGA